MRGPSAREWQGNNSRLVVHICSHCEVTYTQGFVRCSGRAAQAQPILAASHCHGEINELVFAISVAALNLAFAATSTHRGLQIKSKSDMISVSRSRSDCSSEARSLDYDRDRPYPSIMVTAVWMFSQSAEACRAQNAALSL